MHQSQGQEPSQSYDYAFEGKEKKPFGLTEMISDWGGGGGIQQQQLVNWQQKDMLTTPRLILTSREGPSFYLQAAVGARERTWNWKRPGFSSWVTFTSVIRSASIVFRMAVLA